MQESFYLMAEKEMLRTIMLLSVLGLISFSRFALAETTVIGFDPSPALSSKFEPQDDPTYPPGKQLADDHIFQISDCDDLVLARNNKIIHLRGPFHGRVSDYKGNSRCPGFGPSDRMSSYEYYFHSVCEKSRNCTQLCKITYKNIQNKSSLLLTCK